jgi:hypothetical protein
LSDLEGLHFLNGCLLNLLSASSVWGGVEEKEERSLKRGGNQAELIACANDPGMCGRPA